MPELVIDEWLWSDLGNENGQDRQAQALDFLRAIFKKCDRIVTVRDSRFHQKAGRLWDRHDVTKQMMARWYRDTFAFNADKTLLIEEPALPELAPEIARDVKEPDQYLVRAHLHTNAALLVTTDGPLMGALQKHGIAYQARETFVPDYIARHG